MICRTRDEAFQAGLDADCEHDTDPLLCPACRLTAAEVSHMAALHRPHLQPGPALAAPRAA
jgi:hypothetical protein